MRVLCVSVVVAFLLALLQRVSVAQEDGTRRGQADQRSIPNGTTPCDCVCGQYKRNMRIVGGEEADVHEFPWIVLLSYRNKFYCGGTLIQLVCGQYKRNMRIVGGEEADVHEFPWIVLLSYRNKFYCGGTLITSRHVLTAAHCTHQIRKEHITVTIGEHNRNDSTEKLQTRRVVRMLPHRQFSLATFNNDIALLELDSPVTFQKSSVRPACLPRSDADYTGRSATVAGWGRLAEQKRTSNLLLKVEVPIMSESECKSKGYPDEKITENMICAGYTDGKKDACQGDSGGPLHAVDAKNITEVIGIVSWGRGCARPNFPGVYTKVAKYINWIDERLGGECRCTRRPNRTRTPRDDWDESGLLAPEESPELL